MWPISRRPTLKENSPRLPAPAVTPGQEATSRVMISSAVMPEMVRANADHSHWQLVLGPVRDGLAARAVGRAQHRVADLGSAVAVLERRAVRGDVGVVADRTQEVVDLVDERVLPADHVPLRPPVLPEGMVGLGDEHRAEALRELSGRRVRVVDLELVEALDVEAQRALGAVDLELERVLAPAGEARRLDRADRAVGEVDHRLDGVVDGHVDALTVLD